MQWADFTMSSVNGKSVATRQAIVKLRGAKRNYDCYSRLACCDRDLLVEDEFAIVGKVIES